MCVCVCSVMSDSVTPGIVAHQALLSTGFPRQEYWNGLPFPTPIYNMYIYQFSSVAQSCPTLCNTMAQYARPSRPSPTPGVDPNPCPLSRWCHPTLSSSVISFSTHPQSFPASGCFPVSQFFTSGGQSIGVSASHQSFQWLFRTEFF